MNLWKSVTNLYENYEDEIETALCFLSKLSTNNLWISFWAIVALYDIYEN